MNGLRILVVEDDLAARSALRELLQRRGCEVAEAASTAEALMHLEPRPDCVVLDLMLPDRGGELLLWKVRSEKLPVRVVVTTASRDPVRLEAVRRLKPDALLEKPVDLEELYRACAGETSPPVE